MEVLSEEVETDDADNGNAVVRLMLELYLSKYIRYF